MSRGVGKLLRNAFGGNGGKAVFGGLIEGRDGCGRVAAMMMENV